MDNTNSSYPSNLGPIDPNWTITELVDWLSDDAHQHDPALQQPLALIEATLTREPWPAPPSTIALIRSLTMSARTLAARTPSPTLATILLPSQNLSLASR